MNLHRIVDGVAALAILTLFTLEYGLSISFVSGTTMALGDVALHVLIFGTIAWHVFREKLRGAR